MQLLFRSFFFNALNRFCFNLKNPFCKACIFEKVLSKQFIEKTEAYTYERHIYSTLLSFLQTI